MQQLSFVAPLTCLLVLTWPALAEGWQERMSRGLLTHTTFSQDGGRLTLVYDPDRVYAEDAPHVNLVVVMPADRLAPRVVFLSTRGHHAAFNLDPGIALQQGNGPDWAKLITLVKDGGQIGLVTARDSFTVSPGPLPSLRCD